MLPHIGANDEPQMPGLWRREHWAELPYEQINSYRVDPLLLVSSWCTAARQGFSPRLSATFPGIRPPELALLCSGAGGASARTGWNGRPALTDHSLHCHSHPTGSLH